MDIFQIIGQIIAAAVLGIFAVVAIVFFYIFGMGFNSNYER